FPLMDAKGTVCSLVDASTGKETVLPAKDPYGRNCASSNVQASTVHCPFGFQTKYYDSVTGLTDVNKRWLGSDICKWISPDPIAEAGGFNLYGVLNNDPINGIEYLGCEGVLTGDYNPFTWMRKAGQYVGTGTWGIPVAGTVGSLAGGSLQFAGEVGELEPWCPVTPFSTVGNTLLSSGYDIFGDKGAPAMSTNIDTSFNVGGKEFQIVFMNGVLNDEGDVGLKNGSTKAIRDALKPAYPNVQVGYVHNKTGLFNITSDTWYGSAGRAANMGLVGSWYDFAQVGLEQWGMEDDTARGFAEKINSRMIQNPNLIMILVAHSQGGAKLRQAFDRINSFARNRIYVVTAAGAQVRGFPDASKAYRINKTGDLVPLVGNSSPLAMAFGLFENKSNDNPIWLAWKGGTWGSHMYARNYNNDTSDVIKIIIQDALKNP
ncbi:MAG: RHS repeat-associated core domain-containing protein, partial [Victivallales bacterium]